MAAGGDNTQTDAVTSTEESDTRLSRQDTSSISRSFGDYEFIEEIARGGMGVILRVRDRELSRTLAMKVMTGAPGSSKGTDATTRLGLARFLEEAQVTAQLDHPGIVPVYEVGFDQQGQPFYTMKLVKGRDLNAIFKLARAEQEDWNLPRAVGVMVKACQALAFGRDGKTLFSGGFDNTIKVWDLTSQTQLLAIPVNVGLIRRIAVSPTSGILIIGGWRWRSGSRRPVVWE